MQAVRAVFFDAGNTLVFADLERTLAPLYARGVAPTHDQLYGAERTARRVRDQAAAAGNTRLHDEDYWIIYYRELLQVLRLDDAELVAALVQEARRSANWQRVQPGTRDALLALRSGGLRVGLISNSDGRIAELMERVGLGGCFDSITDSGTIGIEKPAPGIFLAALQAVGVTASESVYVGDIYSIDYVGARAAGMQALLFDVSGTYEGTELPRVESLTELLHLMSPFIRRGAAT